MRRQQPDLHDRQRVLIEQRGLCLYCCQPLDGAVFRGGRVIWLELQWDHMIPYAYLDRNPADNWAASCQVCNAIKSDLHFSSIHEARDHILERREQLGYTLDRPAGSRPDEWVEYDMPILARVPEPPAAPRRMERPPPEPALGPFARKCPSCKGPSPDSLYCGKCRCGGLNYRGNRCGARAEVNGRCEHHPLKAA